MSRLLLFGGTFDPPHNGHLNNLRAAAKAVHPDRVIVMPACTPPHKAASATPAALRLEMCRCFAHALPGTPVEVSDWEIARGGRSYTVNTLTMLHERYPDAHLYLTVGSDMLRTFTQWREWQRILRLATLVVQSREPGDAAALRDAARTLRDAGGHVVFAGAAPVPCASSDIRSGVYTRGALQALLPPEVLADIEKYNLYSIT
ncbi:MAG: nicotinate (nicotinamide) nucleotide adenylyltransferase [Gemmiger sp.]